MKKLNFQHRKVEYVRWRTILGEPPTSPSPIYHRVEDAVLFFQQQILKGQLCIIIGLQFNAWSYILTPKTSDPIGAWKCNPPPLLGWTDRPTDLKMCLIKPKTEVLFFCPSKSLHTAFCTAASAAARRRSETIINPSE